MKLDRKLRMGLIGGAFIGEVHRKASRVGEIELVAGAVDVALKKWKQFPRLAYEIRSDMTGARFPQAVECGVAVDDGASAGAESAHADAGGGQVRETEGGGDSGGGGDGDDESDNNTPSPGRAGGGGRRDLFAITPRFPLWVAAFLILFTILYLNIRVARLLPDLSAPTIIALAVLVGCQLTFVYWLILWIDRKRPRKGERIEPGFRRRHGSH